MKFEDLILEAYSVIQNELQNFVIELLMELDEGKIRLVLKNGLILYIRYNNYDEYSYNVLFSKIKLDRCRFDNFDDRWDVQTHPHHFPRFTGKAYSSPMKGDPDHDIPRLCQYIRSNKLFLKDLRFKNNDI